MFFEGSFAYIDVVSEHLSDDIFRDYESIVARTNIGMFVIVTSAARLADIHATFPSLYRTRDIHGVRWVFEDSEEEERFLTLCMLARSNDVDPR